MVNISCPKCGGRTTIRTASKEGRQYFVCVKYPKCKGRVPVEEDLSGVWGEESPALEAARDSPRQRRRSSPTKSVGGTAVRRSGKVNGFYGVIKRPERKGRVSIDKSMSDERDEEKPVPKLKGQGRSKPTSYRSQYRKGPKTAPVLLQEAEKPRPVPYRPQYQRPLRWETTPEDSESSEPQGQTGSQLTSYRARYRRVPKPSPVLPQEPEKPKPAPYRPLYKRPKSWEVVPEEKEQSEPLEPMGSQAVSYRPQYRRMPKPAYVPPQEPGGLPPTPYRSQYPGAEKRRLYPVKQKSPKPRRHKAL